MCDRHRDPKAWRRIELKKTVRASATVATAPDTVFACLADYKRAEVFIEGLEQLKPVGAVVFGQGARFDAVLKVAMNTLRTTIEIASFDPGRLITWSTMGDEGQSLTFELCPEDGGTVVDLAVEYNEPGGIAGALLAPFVAQTVQHRADNALERLRDHLSTLA
jgi:uncharacterized membrane protein